MTAEVCGSQPLSKKERSSNLELMRILLMILIIMHHYVVNSGVMSDITMGTMTENSLFLQIWGMWGKTAINAFVLVSGYFLCTSHLTWLKYVKLLFQIEFYKLLFFILFLAVGYTSVTGKELFKALFGMFSGAGNGFSASFMAFYAFVPFLNKMISIVNRGGARCLLSLLIFYQVITVTFFFSHAFNEITWYMTLYFVGAYLRLYAGNWSKNFRMVALGTLLLVAVSYLSVLSIDGACHWLHKDNMSWNKAYYFVSDSSKILAFLTGTGIFLFFCSLPMRNYKWINTVAKTTFGVLLIHANSDTMRAFLWHDVFQVYAVLDYPLHVLLGHALGTALLVFTVCSLLDYGRIVFIEGPVLLWLRHRWPWLDQPMFFPHKPEG